MLHSIARPPNTAPWSLPTQDGVAAALQQMKSGRAADGERLFAELLKGADSVGVAAIHRLVPAGVHRRHARCHQGGPDGTTAQEGRHKPVQQLRGVQLISMVPRVNLLLIAKPLTTWAEGQPAAAADDEVAAGPPPAPAQAVQIAAADPPLLECQSSFRPQRGCADQRFNLRHLTGMAAAYQMKLFLCFVDLTKALDSISRPALWAVLMLCGLPEQLVAVLQDLHSATSCRVWVGSSFDSPYGTQQDDLQAGLLFNIFMDLVVREAADASQREAANHGIQLGMQIQYRQPDTLPRLDQPKGGSTGSTEVLRLLLADDLAAVACSAVTLHRFTEQLKATDQHRGLVISGSKRECLMLDPRQQQAEKRWQITIRCQLCSKLQLQTQCCYAAAAPVAGAPPAYSPSLMQSQRATGSALPAKQQQQSAAAAPKSAAAPQSTSW